MIRAAIYQDFMDDEISIHLIKTEETSASGRNRTKQFLKIFGEAKWVDRNPGEKGEPFLKLEKLEAVSLLRALIDAMEENGFVRTKLQTSDETKREMGEHIKTLREVSSRLMGILENETTKVHSRRDSEITRL